MYSQRSIAWQPGKLVHACSINNIRREVDSTEPNRFVVCTFYGRVVSERKNCTTWSWYSSKFLIRTKKTYSVFWIIFSLPRTITDAEIRELTRPKRSPSQKNSPAMTSQQPWILEMRFFGEPQSDFCYYCCCSSLLDILRWRRRPYFLGYCCNWFKTKHAGLIL